MTKISKNYLRILQVISSLKVEPTLSSKVGRAAKMSDLEVIALSLTAEFMSIDSENSLFKQVSTQNIPNLIERRQFNKKKTQIILHPMDTL